jgi:6-pyruvoyltetrahydropterin/6-carboxytetrahydropterin synthase
VILRCRYHFDSAHKLPLVRPGHKCGRLHGHTYQLTVALDGPVNDNGWVMDFGLVKAAVNPVIERLDHHYLNEIEGLENPTVEIIVKWIWRELWALQWKHELELHEGLNNSATYRGDQ